MGALPDVLSGYQRGRATPPHARSFAAAWGVELPTRPGLTSLGMQHAARDGALRCMLVLRRGPGRHRPRAARGRSARSSRSTAWSSSSSSSPRPRSSPTSCCRPRASPRRTAPSRRPSAACSASAARSPRPATARPDWAILEALATRLGRPMGFTSAEQIFAEMARLTPIYARHELRAARRALAGSSGRARTRRIPGPPVLHRERFTRGRGRLIPVGDTPPAELPDAEYPLQLTTFRLHHSYGCGLDDPARAAARAREPARHPLDPPRRRGRARHRRAGRPVRIRSRRGEVTTRADRVRRRARRARWRCRTTSREAPSNLVTNDALDPISRMPELKVCAVAVEPCA